MTVHFMAVIAGRGYSVRAKYFGVDGKLYTFTHVARVKTLEHAAKWADKLEGMDIQPYQITTSKEWK